MAATQKNRFLAIQTTLGADKLLVERFSVSERLGLPFQFEAELASSDSAIKFEDIIGTNATVRLQLPNKKTRYFNGYISRFVQNEHSSSYSRYRAMLVPWLWFLTRTSDCRIFQKQKVPDIIEAVFKGHGFKDYKLQLTGTYREWEYCVQYRETDFNFVSRLMEQEGIYYFFTHADGAHTMVLADALSAHQPFPDYDTATYRPPTHKEAETGEFVHQWLVEKEIQPGLVALGDFNFKTPSASLVVNADITRSHHAAGFERFDYPGVYEKRDEGEAYAKIRIQELQAQYELLRGEGTVRGLCAGCKFTLKGHPRSDQNRDYLLTRVSCQMKGGEYESAQRGQGSEFFSCTFTAIPTTNVFRSPRATPKPLIQGPQTGIVVGKKGEEIDTDEYGRVRVQFHWDRYGGADENSSCFVRVSQPAAGKGWGAVSLPRIGQEVVVEFLEGDPDRPLITGRVYNATAKVPYPLPDNKTVSTFKSSSSKGGGGFNEFRFEDKKGSEQIFLHGEKDQDVRIKNDAKEWIGNDRHLVVKNDSLQHVSNDLHELVDGDHKNKVGKDHHLKVGGLETIEIAKNHSLTVKGDVIEVFQGKHSEAVTSDYYLKADNIVIEGQTNVTIKVGQSYIAIESGGITIGTTGTLEIQAQGNSVSIQGDTGVTIKSSAQVEVGSPQTTVKGDAMLTLKGGIVKIN